jgi:hypothetical protein
MTKKNLNKMYCECGWLRVMHNTSPLQWVDPSVHTNIKLIYMIGIIANKISMKWGQLAEE